MSPHPNTPFDAPLRVWLVEDDDRYREMLSTILGDAPDVVCDAALEDGESALRRLEALVEQSGRKDRRVVGAEELVEGRPRTAGDVRSPSDDMSTDVPDLILMDVNLPGMNGLACTAKIKARLPEVSVLILTIRDDADTIYAALSAGASGYLVKESPIEQIVAAIREARNGGMLMPGPVARRVLSFFSRHPSADYGLSAREKEVLEKMVEGLSQKEIAAALFVSLSTVNAHIQKIYAKLHVHSGPAAVAKALRERLI